MPIKIQGDLPVKEILERENIILIIRKSEHNRGSGFSFKIDNNTADSSKPEILKDAKYIIAAVN